MYCTNCGQPNDDDDKFCMHCGQLLKQESEQPIFQNQIKVTDRVNTDTGYLAIALLAMLHVAAWLAWTLTANYSLTGNETLYKSIRVFTVLLQVGQFIASLLFIKRLTYKIIVAIIALLCTAYYMYYLIDEFKRI